MNTPSRKHRESARRRWWKVAACSWLLLNVAARIGRAADGPVREDRFVSLPVPPDTPGATTAPSPSARQAALRQVRARLQQISVQALPPQSKAAPTADGPPLRTQWVATTPPIRTAALAQPATADAGHATADDVHAEPSDLFAAPSTSAAAVGEHASDVAAPSHGAPVLTAAQRLLLADNLFAADERELASATYAAISAEELTRDQFLWAEYQQASCLRELGHESEAERMYRRLAAQPDGGWYAEQAKAWLDLMTQRQRLVAELQQLKQQIQSLQEVSDETPAVAP